VKRGAARRKKCEIGGRVSTRGGGRRGLPFHGEVYHRKKRKNRGVIGKTETKVPGRGSSRGGGGGLRKIPLNRGKALCGKSRGIKKEDLPSDLEPPVFTATGRVIIMGLGKGENMREKSVSSKGGVPLKKNQDCWEGWIVGDERKYKKKGEGGGVKRNCPGRHEKTP